MPNFKTLNGYKVMDADLRTEVATEYEPTAEYAEGTNVMYKGALYRLGPCQTLCKTI